MSGRGFFEHDDFLALRDALPSYLKGFVTFAYKTGWRASEIQNLTWRQVDLNQGVVRLEVGETKNAEGRSVYLDAELRQIFEQQYEARKIQKKLIPFVFPNKEGNDKINEFRGAWNKACRDAGLGYGYKPSKKYVEKWKDTAVRTDFARFKKNCCPQYDSIRNPRAGSHDDLRPQDPIGV